MKRIFLILFVGTVTWSCNNGSDSNTNGAIDSNTLVRPNEPTPGSNQPGGTASPDTTRSPMMSDSAGKRSDSIR